MESSGPLFYVGLANRGLTLAYVERLEGECTGDAVVEIRQGFQARLAQPPEPLRTSVRLQARGKAGTPASGPEAAVATPVPQTPANCIQVGVKTEPSGDFYESLAQRKLTLAYIKRLETECTEDVITDVRQGLEPPQPTKASPSQPAKGYPGASKVQEGPLKESRTLQIILRRCDEAEMPEPNLIPNPAVVEEPEEQPSPALLDPSVLERVFSYLNLETLLDCRQVCKAWDTEALRKIRKLTFVQLPVKLNKSCDPTSKPILNTYLAKFVHVMKFGQGLLPIANYSFKTEANTPLDQPNLNQFFRLFGPSMACLEIDIFTSTDVSQLVAKIARHCPNLEVLRLTSPQKYQREQAEGHGEYEARVPELMSNLKTVMISGNLDEDQCIPLFEATPNLKAIKIGDTRPSYSWHRDLGHHNDPVLRALKMTGRLAQITEISAEVLSFSSFQLLFQETGLSLQALELMSVARGVTPAALEAFLTNHQQSLKSLCLGNSLEPLDGHQWLHLLSLKGMDRLTHFQMSLGPSQFFLACEEPFTDFPHLRRVDIPYVAVAGRITQRVEFPTVTEVRVSMLHDAYRYHDESPFVALGRMFPSTESLTLLNPCIFHGRAAAQVWPGLKNLSLKLKRGDYRDRIEGDFGSLEYIRRLFPGLDNFTRLETLSVAEDVDKKSVWSYEAYRMDMNCSSFQPRLYVKFPGNGARGGN